MLLDGPPNYCQPVSHSVSEWMSRAGSISESHRSSVCSVSRRREDAESWANLFSKTCSAMKPIWALWVLLGAASSEILTPPYFNLAARKKIVATATCGVDTEGPELYCKLVGSQAENDIDVSLIQGQVSTFNTLIHAREFADNDINANIVNVKIVSQKACFKSF